MKARLHTKRSKLVAAGAAALMVVGAGAAYAYWTFGGSGTGDAATAGGSDIVVTGRSTGALVPGGSSALTGRLTNPNTTSVKAGVLTAAVTSVPAGLDAADFTVTGTSTSDGAMLVKGAPTTWSGLTLTFKDTGVNQDAAKNVNVGLTYTLAPFDENATPPVALGTVAVVTDPITGAQSISIYTHQLGSYTIQPGDVLSTVNYTGGSPMYVYFVLGTADANGVITYLGSPTTAEVGPNVGALQLAINGNPLSGAPMLWYTAP